MGNNGKIGAAPGKKPVVTIIIISVLAAAVIGVSAFFLLRGTGDNDTATAGTSGSETSAVNGPDGSGTDQFASSLLKLPENFLINSVTAEKQKGGCVENDTGFLITSSEDVSAETLSSWITLSPAVSFTLDKTAENTYMLRTEEPFPEGSLVNLTLNDENGAAEYRWAFQTAAGFKKQSVFPADRSSYVDTKSGIEIKFTDVPSTENVEACFKISPPVSGKFEVHGKTLAFVPYKLKENTVYTVTVKKGLLSAGGTALDEDISFKFKTYKSFDSNYCYAANGVSETFIKGDTPLVEIYCSDAIRDQSFDVNIYQYKTADDYFNAIKTYSDSVSWEYDEYIFPTDGLTGVYSSSEKLMFKPADNGYYLTPYYLLLPDNLDYGCYLVDVKVGAYRIQRLIQISDISVYAGTLPSESVFFINDASNGVAANGANITLYADGKTYSGKTSSDGTAKISFGKELLGYGAVMIEYGGKTYADVFEYQYEHKHSYDEDFYTYLYTDRECYLSTDTVKIWGVIRPRNGRGAAVPEDLSVVLTYGWWDDDSEAACKPVPVKLNSDGTFTAEISFSDSVERWCYVRLITGGSGGYEDRTVCSKGIRIEDYVKPTYNTVCEVPYTAFMPQTNPVKVSVSAEYFDGTPAAGLDYDISGYYINNASPSPIRTDESGYAETEVTVEDENTWRPRYTYVNIKLEGVENEYSSNNTYAGFVSLFRDVMLEYKTEGSTLSVTTSKADISKLTFADDLYGNEIADIMRGAPADTEVTGVLYRIWYTKRETGSYYDFLLKKTVKKYEYDRNEEVVGTYTINTKNGKGAFENLPMSDDDSSYCMVLSWKDTYGQTVEDTLYIGSRDYSYYVRNRDEHFYSVDYKDTFKENETVEFTLKSNDEEVTDKNGRIFYAFNQRDIISSGTANGTKFTHTFTNEYIPNVSVFGAYFDGKHVFALNGGYYDYYDWYRNGLRFDSSDRELILNITSDKARYAPADTANISVEALDTNGKPVSGAAVSLSLVDEAAFSLSDQHADPLSDIYAYVYYPSAKTHCSYIEHVLNGYGGGEMGSGGEDADSVRKDFRDNAAFLTGVTDASGKTSFTVKLPDNITSWRATVNAVGSDSRGELYAGAEKIDLPSSLSFFLTPVLLPTFTAGDDICMSCKTAGANSGVDITVKVTGEGIDKTLTVPESKAANFGKLPKGEYKALFSAKYGPESDAVELPFEVVDTQLEISVSNTFELNTEKIDISPVRYPVTLSFYDKEYIFCGEVLRRLRSSYGNRTDFEIARAFSLKEFGHITEEEYIKRVGVINGLAKTMDYSEDDIEMTALICAAAPELISGNSTAERFYDAIENISSSSEEISSAYMGLAALSEPVLTQVNALLEHPDGFGEADKLRLCAALALMGDYGNAEKYYLELTDGIKIYDENGEKKAYLVDEDRTRLALITASVLDRPEADAMARYLCELKQREVSTVLELMIYIENYTPEHEGSAVLEYNLDGQKQTVTLKRFGSCVLKMGREQLENAGFKAVSGSVLCTACYEGRITDKDTDPTLSVQKKFTSVSGGWEPGALVKVTLTIPRDKTYRTVDDVIPSCARFAGTDERTYAHRTGQRISLSAYDKSEVSYYIRLVTPGEYVVESAVISGSDGSWGRCDRTAITVEEYERAV